MLSKNITIHLVPQREGTVLTPRKRLVYNTPLPCPPRPLPLPLPLSPSSLFWFQFIKIWATLSPAPSTSTSVCISSSLLHHLLYPVGVTLQAAGWMDLLQLPPAPGPHLATRHSHLQEGHFLAVPTKMWVGQRRFWEKLINTSSSQLGLEIRAPETGQGIAVSVHASQPVHAGSRKPYLGNFREDIAENCGVGAWRAGKGLSLLGMNLVGTGLTKKNMNDPVLFQLRPVGGEGWLAPRLRRGNGIQEQREAFPKSQRKSVEKQVQPPTP